jgi:nucleoside-diphosphate-sugar epimerase
VRNVLDSVIAKPRKGAVKKVVFLSSVGTSRFDKIPYSILNLGGVLTAKRDSEDALRSIAATSGFDYLIVRPGRLVGGPWTNTDVSGLLKVREEGQGCRSGSVFVFVRMCVCI